MFYFSLQKGDTTGEILNIYIGYFEKVIWFGVIRV